MPKGELELTKARKKIVSFIRDRVAKAEVDGVIVGISGGIDSAVAAYLSVEALGSRRVTGLIMPDREVTPAGDTEDANSIANEIGIEAEVIDIGPIHESFMERLGPNKVSEGNLRARIRMSLLYYYANSENKLVVGTGDRSELLLGYYTKYGDGGADILPIADIYKTDVRRLGEVLGVNRRIVSKKSSPRLWAGQTAEAELGLSYETIDHVLKLHFDRKMSSKDISSKLRLDSDFVKGLLGRYDKSAHKRQMPLICEVR